MWQEILSFIGLSAVIFSSMAWLSKKIIIHILSRDIERYKLGLKTESDIAIEKLKFSLKSQAFMYEFRFSKLHDKRAEIIAELYSQMIEMINAARSFVSPVEWVGELSKTDKYQIAAQKIMSFFNYFEKNRIFLDEEICNQIQDLVDKIKDPTMNLMYFFKAEENSKNAINGKVEAWNKAWDSIANKEVPNARKALEMKFRNILGVLDMTCQSLHGHTV